MMSIPSVHVLFLSIMCHRLLIVCFGVHCISTQSCAPFQTLQSVHGHLPLALPAHIAKHPGIFSSVFIISPILQPSFTLILVLILL